VQASEENAPVKMKKWKDLAVHRAGCPYKGVAVYGTDAEINKYHSGNCPGCNVQVKWEEEEQEKQKSSDASNRT